MLEELTCLLLNMQEAFMLSRQFESQVYQLICILCDILLFYLDAVSLIKRERKIEMHV